MDATLAAMDATLATVTIIALLLAWAMAIVAWQRIRAERRQADARVADLMAELASKPAAPVARIRWHTRRWTQAARAVVTGRPLQPRPAAADGPRRPRAAPDRRPAYPPASPDDVRRRPGAGGRRPRPGAAGGPPPRRPAAYVRRAAPAPARARWGHRLAAVAVATILVAGVSLADRTLLDPNGWTAAPPVELLSLDHHRQGDYLAVSGSLRNPPGGRTRTKLSIAATVFDRTGAVIGAGQTPLPVAALAPGSETAFTISLPDADRIDRYRVSFMEDRARLDHVDRRPTAGTAAAAPDARGSRP